MGEEICACIRLKQGEKTTPEDIKAFCKGKVGPSTHPQLTVLSSSNSSPSQPLSPLPPLSTLRPPPSLRLYFPVVCRSPTLRFPGTSCLSPATRSRSQERYVRWKRLGRGRVTLGPIAEGQIAPPVPLSVMGKGLVQGDQLVLVCPKLSQL